MTEESPSAADRMARALLHEVRNVLNPILSAAWLLDTHADHPEKVRELAKRIEEFATAEARITAKARELLALEKGEPATPPAGASDLSVPSSKQS